MTLAIEQSNSSLPASSEAEQHVLGCSILDGTPSNPIFEQAAHSLDPEMFFIPSHRIVFAAMSRLFLANCVLDPMVICEELRRTGDLERVGGMAFIASLIDGVPRFTNIESYVRIVREKFQLRQLIAKGSVIMNRALDAEMSVEEQLRMAERELLDIAARDTCSRWAHIGAVASDYLAKVEERGSSERPVVGFSTGFSDLDYLTLGLERKTVNVVAARPGVGKTAFALGLTENITNSRWNRDEDGLPPVIGWFSMEMDKSQLSRRLLAARAGVDMRALHLGRLTKDQWRSVIEAESWLSRWRTHIDDRCGLSIAKIRESLRQLRQDEKKLDVVFIDYLQLGEGSGGGKFNRAEEVGQFSRGMTQLAKDYDVCVVALSQCNRQAESRGGSDKGRINLGDLRESGQIEQDAYQVWGLYRDEVVNPETTKPNVLEIDILKQRNGPLARVEVLFRASVMKFSDLAREARS